MYIFFFVLITCVLNVSEILTLMLVNVNMIEKKILIIFQVEYFFKILGR